MVRYAEQRLEEVVGVSPDRGLAEWLQHLGDTFHRVGLQLWKLLLRVTGMYHITPTQARTTVPMH